jgi:site-specific recombinase
MFVLNLSVSFGCSLFSAARAYELPGHDVAGLLKGIARRLWRSPLAFVRPPRAAPSVPSDEPARGEPAGGSLTSDGS